MRVLDISPYYLEKMVLTLGATLVEVCTKVGLKAFVHVIDKVYEKERKVAAVFKENMRIVFDDILLRFNYRAIPLNI